VNTVFLTRYVCCSENITPYPSNDTVESAVCCLSYQSCYICNLAVASSELRQFAVPHEIVFYWKIVDITEDSSVRSHLKGKKHLMAFQHFIVQPHKLMAVFCIPSTNKTH
jgi:hypothetical protein